MAEMGAGGGSSFFLLSTSESIYDARTYTHFLPKFRISPFDLVMTSEFP